MKQLLAFAILAASAQAGEVCHSATVPAAVTNWNQTFTLPKHDPSLGALQSIVVTIRCVLTGGVLVENPAPVPAVYTSHFAVLADVSRPGGALILDVEPSVDSVMSLGAFDGTIDFAGVSGQSLTGLQADRERHVVLDSPADLALFTAASPGETVGIGVRALGSSTASGPGALVVAFSSTAAVHVSVCYGYREVCQSTSVASQFTNWQQSRTFAKHDPSLGPLRAVRLRARSTLSGSFRHENLDPSPVESVAQHSATTRILRPDATQALAVVSATTYVDRVTGFDGVIDFAGTSGATHGNTQVVTSGQAVLTSASDLALFTATNIGETITLEVRAMGTGTHSGSGSATAAFQTSVGVEIELCYDYSAPVVPFCFGDGSGANCPCGNASMLGAQQGCLNSLGLGSELRASGFAEIGADSVVLTASNLPATTSVLLYQGTSAISSVFGDGLRCAGGTLMRLGTQNAQAGSAAFPSPGNTISTLGGAVTGSTLRYQAWYRNAVAFCTPAVFNLTNGLAIAW